MLQKREEKLAKPDTRNTRKQKLNANWLKADSN
jgi:hypothetical protein